MRFDTTYLIHIIKRSLPFSILALQMQLFSRLEPILLERLIPEGKIQAGLYAQAYRMIDVFLNFLLLFTTLLLPLFSRLLSKKEDINPLVKLGSNIMFVPAMMIVSICVIYNNDIMTLLYHNINSAGVLRIVILGFIGYSSTLIFGTLLTANNNLKQLNIVAFSSIILNISLNFLLIPKYKALGAAWSSFITQSFSGLIQAYIAYRILKLKYQSINIIMFTIWTILLFTFGYILKLFISWNAGIIATLAIGTIMAILMGLLDLKEIYKIITEGSLKSEGR